MEHTQLRHPLRNRDGYLIGVKLNREFAMKCQAIPANPASIKRCQDFAWSVVKPKNWERDHIPSHLFWWDQGTMLPTMFQHYGDHGKWLDLVHSSVINHHEDDPAVIYSFHHAGVLLDDQANRWLLLLFDRWVKCLMAEIEFLKESG